MNICVPFHPPKDYCMKQQDTFENVDQFTNKYLYPLPKFTVGEYVVLAVVCFWLLRRIS